MTLIDKAEAHDDDLIRRGDICPAVNKALAESRDIRDAIAALPARGVEVRPLVWDRCGNAQGYGCTYMVYEAGIGWNAVLYPSGAAHYQIATGVPEVEAIAVCDNDHRARILAALAPTDAVQARECCDLCGSDVTDMDGHLVHDEGCNGDTYAPAVQARKAALRADEMLRVAARYIRDHYPDGLIRYDDADCDGACVADDCEAAADALIGEDRA